VRYRRIKTISKYRRRYTMGEETKMDTTFVLWKGADRTKIDWHPTIDEEKCVGCGMCVTTCGKNVYDYDWERKKAVVARPVQCLVGCMSCRLWCLFEAISFPEERIVRDFIKKEKILAKAKKEIKEKYGPKNAKS
jgi:NAD-dependent dihydropyrimidine dehydrogenase PreA subunit